MDKLHKQKMNEFSSSKIEEFRKLHQELIELVDQFPASKRDQILFDKWSLKDVLIHVTAWNNHDIFCFEAVMQGKGPLTSSLGDLDEFNAKAIEKDTKLPWEEIYNNFVTSGESLIKIAERLPPQKWITPVDPKGKMSLEDDFKLSIDHYKDDHVPRIKRALDFRQNYHTSEV